jgi:hypothetical protein
MAGYYMSAQIANSGTSASGSSPQDWMDSSQKRIDFLKQASPEEKQSTQWAMEMASAVTAYNDHAGDAGEPSQPDDGMNPLVKVMIAAMKAGQADPSKDMTISQTKTLTDILNQPWAKGWESTIQDAYSASVPQGSLVDLQT